MRVRRGAAKSWKCPARDVVRSHYDKSVTCVSGFGKREPLHVIAVRKVLADAGELTEALGGLVVPQLEVNPVIAVGGALLEALVVFAVYSRNRRSSRRPRQLPEHSVGAADPYPALGPQRGALHAEGAARAMPR
jgi:hypothetical protein